MSLKIKNNAEAFEFLNAANEALDIGSGGGAVTSAQIASLVGEELIRARTTKNFGSSSASQAWFAGTLRQGLGDGGFTVTSTTGFFRFVKADGSVSAEYASGSNAFIGGNYADSGLVAVGIRSTASGSTAASGSILTLGHLEDDFGLPMQISTFSGEGLTGLTSLILPPSNSNRLSAFSGVGMTALTNLALASNQLTSCIMAGQQATVNISNNLMSAAALNAFYTSLGTPGTSKTITVTGNPGTATHNAAIATAKGYTVVA